MGSIFRQAQDKLSSPQVEETLKVYTDGGARGNPGPAAIGVVFYDAGGNEVASLHSTIGSTTNNQAEYRAVIAALEYADRHGWQNRPLEINLDSQLVVEQLGGKYKVKNHDIQPLHKKIGDLVENRPGGVRFTHVLRAQNRRADELVNAALDKERSPYEYHRQSAPAQ